jgi:hypothetical protein
MSGFSFRQGQVKRAYAAGILVAGSQIALLCGAVDEIPTAKVGA